jgi:arylsulfatase A-like enzyme
MTRSSPTTLRPRARLAGAVLVAILFGLAWYAVEIGFLLASGAASDDARELARGALRFLPWHLLVFAALGAVAGAAGALRPLGATAVGWWVLGAAASLFVGARVAEGALHTATPFTAAARCGVVTGVAAGSVALLASVGRVLPRRLRAAWPPAAWGASTILLIGILRGAGPRLALGETSWAVALEPLTASHGLAAAVVAGALLALGARLHHGAAACAVLALAVPARAATEVRTHLPDVYVFLLDTLRHDHLGEQPDGAVPTPVLAARSAEFFRFGWAFAPSTRTSRSMPGIMTSLSVRVVGPVIPPQAETLVERLREGGIATFGISANPQVSADFGYDQGFDRLVDRADSLDFQIVPVLKLLVSAFPAASYQLGVARAALYYPPIEELRRRALRLLEESPGPTFVYAHTMDVHGPYLPPRRMLPPSYRRSDFFSYFQFLRLSGSELLRSPEYAARVENLRQRYAGAVRHTDEQLAEWIDDLRARGRWDEAVVWILSDHGEAFAEHGVAGHGYSYVGSSVVRVPLWLKLPRSLGLRPRQVDDPVSTYDLMPTTLALLGIAPVEPSFGEDLTPILKGDPADPDRVVVVETDDGPRAALYSAVRGTWKLDVHFSAEGVPDRRSLYDLALDPGETVDRSAQHPTIVAELEAAIERRREQEHALSLEARRVRTVDPATRERLRSLGYAD